MGALRRIGEDLYQRVRSRASAVEHHPVVHLADGSPGCLPLWNVNVNRNTGRIWADERGWERAW
eukprot:6991566-Alexandrium_andersonii.AAC.1